MVISSSWICLVLEVVNYIVSLVFLILLIKVCILNEEDDAQSGETRS